MPVAKKWSYFDHAAVAPIPKPALDAISKWASEATEDGDAVWMAWNRQHEECRKTAANLINAQVSEIGLVPNTTFGINLVADGLDWKEGDNVVLPEHEFPSNVYPWMSLQDRGVELRQVPLDGHKVCIDRIADACDERTRIVSASWVGYASGARLDPKELSTAVHEKGALFFLDAIQGMGVFPLDVVDADIDFLAADGHKWMLGPEGAGIFFLKHQHLDLLRPMNVGWNSVAQWQRLHESQLGRPQSGFAVRRWNSKHGRVHRLGGQSSIPCRFWFDGNPIADRRTSIGSLRLFVSFVIGCRNRCAF